MINTVCFDLDATLVRSDQVILKSFEHVFKMFLNIEKPLDYYKKYMGPPLYITFGEYTKDPILNKQMVDEFIRYYKTIEIPLINLCPGVIETLEYLKSNGYKIALITTKFYTSSVQSLNHLDIHKYFDSFMCLERQRAHKPNPEPIIDIMKEFNVSNENVIMVGDNEVDIMCGKNANVKQALVMYNSWSIETKDKVNPTYTLNDMRDLIKILEENK